MNSLASQTGEDRLPRKLTVAFLLPTSFSVGNPGNGIAAQARNQAAALERAGHEVIRLNPWEWTNLEHVDVVHFYGSGLFVAGVETLWGQWPRPPLVGSPIIDSNQSNLFYRLAASAGGLSRRFSTSPGEARRQLKACDIVACRSEHERARVVKGLGVDIGRTRIVLNGVDVDWIDGADPERVWQKYSLPNDFVLHVSAFTQARKNVPRLISACAELGYPLIIAGHSAPGQASDEVRALMRRMPNGAVLDFLPKYELAGLLKGCRVFCLPSEHEGTGLAALEAAAAGANVVITNRGGTHDYFGRFAEYADPYSTASIRECIRRAWAAPRNAALRTHVRSLLTWDASARALLDAYAVAALRAKPR